MSFESRRSCRLTLMSAYRDMRSVAAAYARLRQARLRQGYGGQAKVGRMTRPVQGSRILR